MGKGEKFSRMFSNMIVAFNLRKCCNTLPGIVIALVVLFGQCAAQQPDWLWAKGAGGGGQDEGMAVAVDAAGNTYVTGYFTGSFTLGTTTLTGGTAGDVFTAKYDPEGNVLWAASAGGTGTDNGTGIGVDAAGNCYITGHFSSTSITFGATTLTRTGSENIFVVKYDASGNVLWANRAGGTGFDAGSGIAVDAAGNSYVTGNFGSSSIVFGSTTLTNANAGFADAFVVKYNTSGTAVWANRFGGSNNDEGNAIVLDAAGKCYVTGFFVSTPMTIGGYPLTNPGTASMFVAEYDAGGGIQFAFSVGASGVSISGKTIAVDGSGNIYFGGHYTGTSITFGSTTLTNAGSQDGFLAKFDLAGNALWATPAGGANDDDVLGLAVDALGNSVITGYFSSPTITFGASTFSLLGLFNNFTVKYDASGNVNWGSTAGGTGGALGYGVVIDGTGNIHETGEYASAGTTLGSNSFLSGGGYDFYVGVLGDPLKLDAVKDVPNDQGGKVFVQWQASPFDAKNVAAIWHYEVYLGTYTSGTAGGTAVTPDDPPDNPKKKNVTPAVVDGLPTLYWSLMGTVDAKFLDNYSYSVATPSDSGPQGDSRYYYKVRACTYSASTYWESNIEYGQSVDNLSPVVPSAASLSGISNGWIVLNWKKNRTDSDLHGYVIYRSTTESFVPDQSNRLVTISDTAYTDKATTVGETYYYRVTAIDIHGNESTPTSELSQQSLAVELATFDGFVQSSGGVRLEWSTLSETDNYGFEIQRRQQGTASFTTLPNSFVAGAGTTQEPQSYSFSDTHVSPGTYYYRIKQIDTKNNITYGSPIKIVYSATGVSEDGLPVAYAMNQNYPNPFNPSTSISYALPAESYVTLKVFNMLGQEVATLVDGVQDAGYKSTTFEMGKLSSGVYVYQLNASTLSGDQSLRFSKTAKMMLVR